MRTITLTVTPAEDAPGLFVARCLEFDLMSQGETAHAAFEAIFEAVQMVLDADRADGLDSFEVRLPAPREDWCDHYVSARRQRDAMERFTHLLARPPAPTARLMRLLLRPVEKDCYGLGRHKCCSDAPAVLHRENAARDTPEDFLPAGDGRPERPGR